MFTAPSFLVSSFPPDKIITRTFSSLSCPCHWHISGGGYGRHLLCNCSLCSQAVDGHYAAMSWDAATTAILASTRLHARSSAKSRQDRDTTNCAAGFGDMICCRFGTTFDAWEGRTVNTPVGDVFQEPHWYGAWNVSNWCVYSPIPPWTKRGPEAATNHITETCCTFSRVSQSWRFFVGTSGVKVSGR